MHKFSEELPEVRRIAKVTKYGRNWHYRAIIVIGNKVGLVRMRVGRSFLRFIAINRAREFAKLYLIPAIMSSNYSVTFVLDITRGPVKIIIRPPKSGSGVIAGSSIRSIFELAGLKIYLPNVLVSEIF